MSEVLPGERFKTNVIDFLDTCKVMLKDLNDKKHITINSNTFQEYEDIINLIKILHGDDLIKKFVMGTGKYWGEIKSKNQEFFHKNSSKIFGDVSVDKLDILKHVFVVSGEINNDISEIRECIWDYLHTFVKISIKFIFSQRLIEIKLEKDPNTGGNKKHVKLRTIEHFKDIDIISLGKTWNIELYEGFLHAK